MVALMAVLGLLIGGLANQLATDLPARRALTLPHCPYCGRPRPWWLWLSLPAYLVGRARCSACGAPIRIVRPLVELGLAVVYAYMWIVFGPSIRFVLYALYMAILGLVLVTDIERRLILNVVMVPAIVVALIAGFFTPGMCRWCALLGGAIGFGFFFLAAVVGNALFGSGALGGGDVKLAAFVGLVTGFPLAIVAMLLAILAGGVVSLFLVVTRLRGLRDPIPYGPFLVAGAVVTLLWGPQVSAWLIR